jgi:hypothetical protein
MGAKVEKIEVEAWASPATPDACLPCFAKYLQSIGHTVLEIDEPMNRVKVLSVVKSGE